MKARVRVYGEQGFVIGEFLSNILRVSLDECSLSVDLITDERLVKFGNSVMVIFENVFPNMYGEIDAVREYRGNSMVIFVKQVHVKVME